MGSYQQPYYRCIAIKNWRTEYFSIYLVSIHATSTVEIDQHFDPNNTRAKFHVCISNGLNSIVLTKFCCLSETNTRNHLYGGPQYKTCP